MCQHINNASFRSFHCFTTKLAQLGPIFKRTKFSITIIRWTIWTTNELFQSILPMPTAMNLSVNFQVMTCITTIVQIIVHLYTTFSFSLKWWQFAWTFQKCIEAFRFYFIPLHLSQCLFSSWILRVYHIQFSMFPFKFSFFKFLKTKKKKLEWFAAMSRRELIFFHELVAKTYSLWLWMNRTLIVTWNNVHTRDCFFTKRYFICFVFAKVCLQLMFSSCLCLWVSFRLVSSILCFLHYAFFHRM